MESSDPDGRLVNAEPDEEPEEPAEFFEVRYEDLSDFKVLMCRIPKAAEAMTRFKKLKNTFNIKMQDDGDSIFIKLELNIRDEEGRFLDPEPVVLRDIKFTKLIRKIKNEYKKTIGNETIGTGLDQGTSPLVELESIDSNTNALPVSEPTPPQQALEPVELHESGMQNREVEVPLGSRSYSRRVTKKPLRYSGCMTTDETAELEKMLEEEKKKKQRSLKLRNLAIARARRGNGKRKSDELEAGKKLNRKDGAVKRLRKKVADDGQSVPEGITSMEQNADNGGQDASE